MTCPASILARTSSSVSPVSPVTATSAWTVMAGRRRVPGLEARRTGSDDQGDRRHAGQQADP